jgi:hypothetical protein
VIFFVSEDPLSNMEELLETKMPAGFLKHDLKLLRNEEELVQKVRQVLNSQVNYICLIKH